MWTPNFLSKRIKAPRVSTRSRTRQPAGLRPFRPRLERLDDRLMLSASPISSEMLSSDNSDAAVLAEALSWGIRSGATEEQLIGFIKLGSGNSWIVENFQWVRPLWTDPPPITHGLAAKDLSYALKVGLEMRQPCPLVGLACELYKGPPPKLPEGPQR